MALAAAVKASVGGNKGTASQRSEKERMRDLDREAERERERKREKEIRAFKEFSTKLPIKKDNARRARGPSFNQSEQENKMQQDQGGGGMYNPALAPLPAAGGGVIQQELNLNLPMNVTDAAMHGSSVAEFEDW